MAADCKGAQRKDYTQTMTGYAGSGAEGTGGEFKTDKTKMKLIKSKIANGKPDFAVAAQIPKGRATHCVLLNSI